MGLGSGLLGLDAGSGANKFEGVGRMLGGACGLDRGRMLDGWRLVREVFLDPNKPATYHNFNLLVKYSLEL